MQSNALQDLVKKIFGDEKTRGEFTRDPDSVLSKYNLTEPEKKAVLKTHSEFGLINCGSPTLEATLNAASGWHSPIA